MNDSQRAAAHHAHRAAIEAARTASIAALFKTWTEDMLFDDMPPALLDMVRASFYEGAWRVAENVATVAIEVRQKSLADMAEALVAEAFAFDDSPAAKRAFSLERDA